MTVNTISSIAEFDTNGVTTNYPFYFKFLANEDLVVTYINPVGASTTLTLGTHYTVNGAGNDAGGSVITVTALAGPGQLVVSREMDAFQQTSLRNQGKFLAETHEDVFDRLTMLIQQGFAIFTRALTRPFGRDYFFAENRRITSVKDPVDDQDAATKHSVQAYVASVLETGQGPINNAANVAFVRPDTTVGTVQDIGSRLPEKGASVVGWTRSALSSAIISAGQMLNAQKVNIWEFASHVTNKPSVDPGSWDWTPAYVAADAFLQGDGPLPRSNEGVIVTPPGFYPVTSFTVSLRVHLSFDGGVIVPFDFSTPRTHLIKFLGLNRVYNLCIDMNFAINYDTAVWCRGRYIDFVNPDIWRYRCAYIFGDPAWATDPALGTQGDSEITINGGNTNWGITVGKLYGMNTIVHIGGGHKAYSLKYGPMEESDPRWAAWSAIPANTFVICGALLYITGGVTGNYSNEDANFLCQLQPVEPSPFYRNSYGKVILNGTHIETGFLIYCEPSVYPAQDNKTYVLQASGCHGYIREGIPYWANLGLCKQLLDIRACGFYGESRANILYAPEAIGHVEPASFTNNFGEFFQTLVIRRPFGYAGYTALVAGGSSQALSTTASTIVMPTVSASDVNTGLQSLWYNSTTGRFTAQTDMYGVVVDVGFYLASGLTTDTTQIFLYVDNAVSQVVSCSGQAPSASFTIRKLAFGSVIDIKATQSQSRSLDGSPVNRMSVVAGRI